MTGPLAILLVSAGVLGLYLAVMTARTGFTPTAFFDADRTVPGWAMMFGLAGLMLAGVGLPDQLGLVARFGLQASHVGIGMVPAALAALLVYKRLWLAAKIGGFLSSGDALGNYYRSVTLRLGMLALTLLFGMPYAAHLLSGTAGLLALASGGAVPHATGVWLMAFLMFLPAVIGGWRALVYLIAIEAVLYVVLLLATAGFAEAVLPTTGFADAGIPVAAGMLPDRIPGVIQYSVGVGKDMPVGGLFTTMAIFSHALAFVGLALSPVLLQLSMTTRGGRGMSISTVWLVAGLGGAFLILVVPFLAARMAGGPNGLAETLSAAEPLVGAGFLFAVMLAGKVAVLAFTGGGAILVARELVTSYLLPGMTPAGDRLAARITIAVFFLVMALLASFAPVTSAIVGSLALPLSLQLLPALLGVAFVRWISRSAVLAGLIVSALVVFFTEPAGLVFFEGLFVDLPWGRWPLTIHSALWGLSINLVAVLLVSIFTRAGDERAHRDRLHDEFAARWRTDFGGRAARGAKWSLTLIWTFLALGPGAILGNTFFSQPIFTQSEALLGIPSLWAWQIFFWLLGVPLVWWLAERSQLGRTSAEGIRPVEMRAPVDHDRQAAPDWIAASIARVAGR